VSADTLAARRRSLSLLAAIISAQMIATIAAHPEAARSIGSNGEAMVTSTVVRLGLVAVSAIIGSVWAGDRPMRARLVVIGATISLISTSGAAVAADSQQWLASMAVGGIGEGLFASGAVSLLIDLHPIGSRSRWLDRPRRSAALGSCAGLAAVLLADALNMTWRGALLVVVGVSLPFFVWSVQIQDPGIGVREIVGADGLGRTRWAESFRRVTSTRGVVELLGGYLAVGQVSIPTLIWGRVWLHDRWGQSGIDAVFAMAVLSSIVVVLTFRSRCRSESLPGRTSAFAQEAAGSIVGAVRMILLAVTISAITRWLPDALLIERASQIVCALCVCRGLAGVVNAISKLDPVLADLSVASNRTTLNALAVAASASGAIGGLLLGASIDRRFGAGWAIATAVFPALLGGRGLLGHIDRIATGRRAIQVELEDAHRATRATNHHEPKPNEPHQPHQPNQPNQPTHHRSPDSSLLRARDIDVSYSGVQVLFGTSLRIEAGEMVALLGTNGAGKSTLLRAISGLVTSDRGTVRLHGVDVTSLSAERRVAAGMAKIPGGKAIFGPLTVAENLKLYATSMDRSIRNVDLAINDVLSTFPRLEEKRNQVAETLSGGEQQMLALGKAVMLKPQLLLIDELSLGLAPAVVAELLALVRSINTRGTAVLLVEQSVNVALSVAHRAVFMEKGEVRFEGPSAELAQRDDLLRAVFLGGAAARMS
jgi:ABC-type branched-subunit amino acid transport system ATPase component